MEHGQAAQRIAEESTAAAELGVSYRVLGDVWLGLNDLQQARAAFERSLPLLEQAHEEDELRQAQRGYAATRDV